MQGACDNEHHIVDHVPVRAEVQELGQRLISLQADSTSAQSSKQDAGVQRPVTIRYTHARWGCKFRVNMSATTTVALPNKGEHPHCLLLALFCCLAAEVLRDTSLVCMSANTQPSQPHAV